MSAAGKLASGQSPDSAWILVKLPPGAEKATIAFGDYKTTTTGKLERWFLTPPLTPGKTFSYDVTASWKAGGKDYEFKEKASVSAGKETTVDFTKYVKKDDGKKDDTKKDDTKKDDTKKDDTKKDDGKKDDTKKDDTKKDDTKKDDGKKDDTKKEPKNTAGPSRTFQFTYTASITGLKPGEMARIWIPLPPTTAEQEVAIDKQSVPGKSSIATESLYGNRILFTETTADASGSIPLALTFKVTRKEVKSAAGFLPPKEGEKVERFLQPDKLVPTDGKPLELIKDKQLGATQIDKARALYDLVNTHMTYSKKGTGWGNGDAVWACDSRYGNCTDFHSLFIALARSQKIPAKFEMGFAVPAKHGSGAIGGYHCWAWFLPDGKGWVPVDISEANQHPDQVSYCFGNLTADRVMFSTGRDIDLVPRQAGPALNYFIYPYAEVEGKALPREQVKTSFSYSDVN
jgi:uncharacterized protein (TIGR03000 family)